MKYAKKLLTLGLSLALVLSLAACSGGDTAGGNTATPTPAGDNGGDVTNTEAPATEDPSSPKNWTSAADLEGKTIAVQEGTTGDILVSESIANTTPVRFKAVTACALELMNGNVDCIVVDSLPAQALVDANPDQLMILDFPANTEVEAYAIGVNKTEEGAALAEEFNAAMATLKENGTYEALYNKHINGDDTVELPELPTVTESKGTLVMGTNCEFEPFEYLDSQGNPQGFDIDYAKYLCATMGYELEIENMNFDALPAALQTGQVDFLCAGLSVTEERLLQMDFTDNYYESTQAIVVLK